MEDQVTTGRPRSLSDIPEIVFEATESQNDDVASDSQSASQLGQEHLSAVESSRAQARIQASHNLRYNQSPRRPPPTSSKPLSLRQQVQISELLAYIDRSRAMETPSASPSAPASASAPASLRAERSETTTPSPASDQSFDASLNRSSSATGLHLISTSLHARSISPSPVATSNITSPPGDYRDRESQRPSPHAPVQTGTMNLKLLTCHWWFHAGGCRFSANDCLYAHHDTGKHAEAPRQITPGQPAVAGRNADRRLRQAGLENNMNNFSLNDARNIQPNPHMNLSMGMGMGMRGNSSSSSLADMTNVFNGSAPSTPGIGMMLHSPPGHNTQNMPFFPILANAPLHYATNAAQLENEVRFFRTLVEQGGKEKEVMVTTIESLQVENQALRTAQTSLTSENTRLVDERNALRNTVALLQQQQRSTSSPLSRSSTPISTLRRSTPGSVSWTDFGTIGGKRAGS